MGAFISFHMKYVHFECRQCMEAGASEQLAILTLIPSPLLPALLHFGYRANFTSTGHSSGAPHDECVTQTAESCTAHVLLQSSFSLCQHFGCGHVPSVSFYKCCSKYVLRSLIYLFVLFKSDFPFLLKQTYSLLHPMLS